MKKATSATPKKPLTVPITVHFMILYTLVLGLIVACAVLGVRAAHTQDFLNKQNDTAFGELIRDAAFQAHKPAAVEPLEQRQYIYEAKLRFGLSSGDSTLLYYYQPADGSSDESVHISTRSIMNSSYSMLNPHSPGGVMGGVPQLQACTRAYIVRFQPRENTLDGYPNTYEMLGAMPLADGRTAHIYRNQDCSFANDETHKTILRGVEAY